MVKVISFLLAGILFVGVTVYVLSRYNSLNNLEKYYMEEGIEYDRDYVIETYKNETSWRLDQGEVTIFLVILMPIVLVAILFGEEKRNKTFEVLSVMPYTKYEIFFNKLLAALLSIVLPFIINGLIMILALLISTNLRMFYSAKQVLTWMSLNIYYQLPMLGFSLIFGTITGTTISQIILTIIFLIFPIGFPLLIAYNLELLGFAGHFSFNNILSEMADYTIMGVFDSLNGGFEYYIFYITLSIIMIIISKILFDKNKVERNKETLEFEKTEGFFKVGVSVCTALLMAIIFSSIFDGFSYESYGFEIIKVIIGYIVGGTLGYFLAQFSIKINRSKA